MRLSTENGIGVWEYFGVGVSQPRTRRICKRRGDAWRSCCEQIPHDRPQTGKELLHAAEVLGWVCLLVDGRVCDESVDHQVPVVRTRKYTALEAGEGIRTHAQELDDYRPCTKQLLVLA